MRKFKYIFLVALSFCGLLLIGCIKDASSVGYGDGDAQIEVVLSTLAVNGSDDPNATNPESMIKSAYVFIFNEKGVLENPGETAVTTLTPNGEVINDDKKLNAVWQVYKGLKDIYIVTNPDAELAGRLVSMSVTNGLESDKLKEVLTDESVFTTDVAAFSTKGMLMTGEVTAKAVSGSSTTVPVTVTRRHARIDFSLRKAKDLEGAVVVVKGVKYKDQIRKTIVFPSTPSSYSANEENRTTVDVTVDEQQATTGAWSDNSADYTAITNFYSFERPAPSSTKAACLEMIVSIDGTDRVLPVYICSTAIGTDQTGNDKDKPIAIEANHVYKVMGTLTRKSIDLALKILDWEDADVNGDIYGTDFTVSKTKVEVHIVNNVGSSETIDLSASENITFIEYEYNGKKDSDPLKVLPAGLTVTGAEALKGSTTTGSVTFTTGSTCDAEVPVYLWFKAGNIKKRIEVNCLRYFFSVEAPSNGYPYTGGSQQYKVTSYEQMNSIKSNISWTATEFSVDGGVTWTTRPEWVTTFTENEPGSTTAKSFTAILAKSASTNSHNKMLKEAMPISYLYDLSTNGGLTIQNTANCYIVNKAGTYSLPLVYGNAIKDGAVNTEAFKPGVGLSPFLSATETIPDDGKIKDADGAKLLWQDAKGLVTKVALSGGNLTFTVNKETIQQGNAVVAVTNTAGEVLWSWHIWVTDYNPLIEAPQSFVNHQGFTYKFMPVNIGWCDGLEYPGRSVQVRFTQNKTGIRKVMDMNQLAGQEPGYSPYFQWGRKDPFVSAMKYNVSKTWYDTDGVEKIDKNPAIDDWIAGYDPKTAKKVIQNGILNPGTFCSNQYMDSYYVNLWSAKNTETSSNDNPVIKTVYDPSPVGYHMPASNAFTGFTTTGDYTTTASEINGTWNMGTESWTFAKSGSDAVTFAATGYRDFSSGELGRVGGEGNYWSAVPSSTEKSRYLSFGSDGVGPSNINYRAYGFSARCVQEQE